jgi:hypothetical protein
VRTNGETRQVLVVNPEALGGLAAVPAGGNATLESIDLSNPVGFARAFKEAAKVFAATYPQSAKQQPSS